MLRRPLKFNKGLQTSPKGSRLRVYSQYLPGSIYWVVYVTQRNVLSKPIYDKISTVQILFVQMRNGTSLCNRGGSSNG